MEEEGLELDEGETEEVSMVDEGGGAVGVRQVGQRRARGVELAGAS